MKEQSREEGIWLVLYSVLPSVFLSSLSSTYFQFGILYSALSGGTGAIFGLLIFTIVKGGNRFVKMIGLLMMAALIVFSFIYIKGPKALNPEDWMTQHIGSVEFDSPEKLSLLIDEVPIRFKEQYKSFEIYTDQNEVRLTGFVNSELITDTLQIENAFVNVLEDMLSRFNPQLSNPEFKVIASDGEEVSMSVTFNTSSGGVKGFGFMVKTGNRIESLWLIPVTKGFSEEYIKEFEVGIIPDYE